MSHNLEIVDGVAQIAYAGETPWHGLGVEVPHDLTPEQMMEAAGLDWTVSKRPMLVQMGDNEYSVVPSDRQALVRDSDGKVLDVVGSNWNPVQNAEAFGFFHDFVMEGNMFMNTAGSLNDGRMIWAMARIGEGFTLKGGDKVLPYLLFTNPHQYGKSVDVRFTAVRVVCNNTLTAALSISDKSRFSMGHRSQFNAETVKEVLGLSSDNMKTYEEQAKFLSSKRFTEETKTDYLYELFGVDREDTKKKMPLPAREINAVMNTQPGAEMSEGSWWQVFNAVTFHADHIARRSDDTRLKSAWFGPNKKRKENAMELALEYADKA